MGEWTVSATGCAREGDLGAVKFGPPGAPDSADLESSASPFLVGEVQGEHTGASDGATGLGASPPSTSRGW
eukprot:3398960-Alexandrium_andersonii.AAC.1